MGSCGPNGHGTAVVPWPHAEGPAAMLMPQDVFADTLFRVTNSDHLTELKHKLTRICGNTGIDKRHFHLTEETLAAHPELFDPELPSLDTRVDMTVDAVPKLAQRAAAKAIAEWGRPAADITHLVFTTYSACGAPSADLRLATLLGLRPTVSRTMLSLHGCYGGGRALGLAKELAENNRGARVLVACSETTLVCFAGPDGGNLVGHAIFGDGAGAVIVGAGPFLDGEQRPIFEMVHATQTTVPKTEHTLGMQVSGAGIDFHLSIQVPTLIGQNVQGCLIDAFAFRSSDTTDGGRDDDDDGDHLPSPCSGNGKWNDLFWAVHPGGRQILDNIDKVLKLEPEMLAASRHVLREYGNMSGATIVFVLDELRHRRSLLPEWGAMMAFGPGITIETMVLRSPR